MDRGQAVHRRYTLVHRTSRGDLHNHTKPREQHRADGGADGAWRGGDHHGGLKEMWKLIIAGGVLAVAAGVVLVQLRDEPSGPTATVPVAAAGLQVDRDTRHASTTRARRRHVARKQSTRMEIARIIRQEVEPLRGVEQVEAYLARLEARARAKGRVTALEVEPGIAAIRGLLPRIGQKRVRLQVTAFGRRMTSLAARLDGRTLSKAPVDLPRLARRIERAPDKATRHRLVRRYIEEAHSLPPSLRRGRPPHRGLAAADERQGGDWQKRPHTKTSTRTNGGE
jgi:hypothetical protein